MNRQRKPATHLRRAHYGACDRIASTENAWSSPNSEPTFMSLLDIHIRGALYVSLETKSKILEVVKRSEASV